MIATASPLHGLHRKSIQAILDRRIKALEMGVTILKASGKKSPEETDRA